MLEVLTLSTPIKDSIIKHNKDILNFYLTKSGHFYSRRDWGGGGGGLMWKFRSQGEAKKDTRVNPLSAIIMFNWFHYLTKSLLL